MTETTTAPNPHTEHGGRPTTHRGEQSAETNEES
jgi:hypothetical protein